MAINTSQAPPAAWDALRAGMDFLRGATETPARRAAFEPRAHETWYLGLDAIEAKKGIAAAERTGWRYLLGGRVAADVYVRDDGYKFAGLNEGPFVQQISDTIEKVRDQVGKDDYEPRLLQIPALYIAALWLHGLNNELFIPLEPSHPEVSTHRIYARQDFEAALVRAADARKRAVPPSAYPDDEGHAP
jgi:hypothetical protein